MGKSRQYVNNTITRGSCPKADTLANMLAVCEYNLCALPIEETPSNALLLEADAPTTDMAARLKVLRDKKEKLQAEEKKLQREIRDIDEQLKMFGDS